MYIAQLLHSFLLTPDDEVVKTDLPEGIRLAVIVAPQTEISRVSSSLLLRPQDFSGGTLFQDLHHQRWIAAFRFADKQMNVFRHDHVPDDYETISPAYFFQNSEKQGSAS